MLVAAKIVFFITKSSFTLLKCEIYIFYDYAFMRRIEAFDVMNNIFL